MTFRLLVTFLFVVACTMQPTHAQTTKTNKDSSLAVMQKLLLQSEAQRIRDSIRAAVLMEELQNVRRSSASAMAMRQELDAIRQKDSLRMALQAASIDSLREITTGAPVTLVYDTLFYFYNPIGPFHAKDRAENATTKIEQLYKLVTFYPDSLNIIRLDNYVNLTYSNNILLSLHENDALWENKSLEQLAQDYQAIIVREVNKYRQSYNIQNILIRFGKAALVVLLTYLGWISINKLYHLSIRKILRGWGILSEGFKFHNYQALTNRQLQRYLLKAFYVLKITAQIGLIYLSVYLLFSTFPITRSWSETLTHWVLDPIRHMLTATYEYLPRLITIVVLLILGRYVAKLLRYFSLEVERGALKIRGFHPEWARPTYIIVRFLWFAFIFVLIFPYLPGSDSVAFKGVSVFLGVLFSIGSSSAVSNTIAGFIITYMRPFRVGDWIKVANVEGKVIEKTFLVTRIRTIHNEDVTVPNSAILAGHTVNYSSAAQEDGLIVNAKAGFIYELEVDFVHQILKRAALKTPFIDTTREPFIFHTQLNDFYALYEINAYTHHPDRMYFIQSDLYLNIQRICKEVGVNMVIPQKIDIHTNED